MSLSQGCVVACVLGVCAACSDVAADPPATNGAAGGASGSAALAGAAGMTSVGGAGASGASTTAGGAGAGNGGAGAGSGGAGAGNGGTGAAGTGGGAGTGTGGAGTGGTSGAGGVGGATSSCETKLGKALRLDGTKIDILSANLGADLPGGNTSRTLELWVKFTGNDSWKAERSVVETGKHVTAGNQILGIDMSGRASATQGRFGPYTNGFSDNNGDQGVLLDAAPDVGWLHLGWSFDTETGLSFTVNGVHKPVQMDGTKLKLDLTPGIVTLGASQNFGDPQGFQGVVDELKLWSVSKTPAEILAGMRVVPKPDTPGLVAYYRFDEGTGTSVADATKKPSHTLGPCAAKSDICPAVNDAAPQWVDSDIPGDFSCAP